MYKCSQVDKMLPGGVTYAKPQGQSLTHPEDHPPTSIGAAS